MRAVTLHILLRRNGPRNFNLHMWYTTMYAQGNAGTRRDCENCQTSKASSKINSEHWSSAGDAGGADSGDDEVGNSGDGSATMEEEEEEEEEEDEQEEDEQEDDDDDDDSGGGEKEEEEEEEEEATVIEEQSDRDEMCQGNQHEGDKMAQEKTGQASSEENMDRYREPARPPRRAVQLKLKVEETRNGAASQNRKARRRRRGRSRIQVVEDQTGASSSVTHNQPKRKWEKLPKQRPKDGSESILGQPRQSLNAWGVSTEELAAANNEALFELGSSDDETTSDSRYASMCVCPASCAGSSTDFDATDFDAVCAWVGGWVSRFDSLVESSVTPGQHNVMPHREKHEDEQDDADDRAKAPLHILPMYSMLPVRISLFSRRYFASA
jgi:hypothetical protein